MKFSPRNKIILLLVFLGLWHAIVGSIIGLGDAEALYFCYSHHLSLSYLDHPPMIGWLLWLSTSLFGVSTASVRLVPTICHLLTLAGVVYLAKNIYGSWKSSLYSAIALCLIPMMTIGGIAAAPDAPASAIWIWTVALFYQTVQRYREDQTRFFGPRAILIGLLISLCFLSKYTGILLVLGALCSLFHPTLRRLFRSPWMWIAAGFCFLGTLPVIVWNIEHDWASISHRFIWTQQGFGPSFQTVATTIGGQFLYLGPPMAIALFLVLFRLVKERKDPDQYIVLCFSGVPLLFTLVLCLFSPAAEPHWTAQGYLCLTVAVGGYLSKEQSKPAKRWVKILGWSAVGFFILVFVVLHISVFSMIHAKIVGSELYEARYDLSNELHGWDDVVDDIKNVTRDQEPIVSNHYTICSQIVFALAKRNDDHRVICLSEEIDDFDLWGLGRVEDYPSVLYIEDDRFGIPADQVFPGSRLTEVDSSKVWRSGIEVRGFRFIRVSLDGE